MKHIIFGGAFFLTGLLTAQVEITKHGNPALLNGTEITHTVTGSGDSNVELFFKNTGSTDKYWKITRKQLTAIPANWEDYICWGIEGEAGQCYSSSTQNPWTTPDGLTVYDSQFNPISGLPAGESGLAAVHFVTTNCGTANYRYYVHDDGGAFLDSVDVKVVFSCASIGEKEIALGHVFPNPASTELSIDMGQLTNYAVQIFDLTGKLVFTAVDFSNGTINVSSLENGLYSVRIVQNDRLVQTLKVAVNRN
jgi:hypothetical protein